MRISLIRPPAVESFRFSTTSITPPLGLAYIAGSLERAGYDFEVIDSVALAPSTRTKFLRGYLTGLPLHEIAQRIIPGTRIVGISAIFTHEWPAIVHMIDLIRKQHPEVVIIVGGEHVTSMPEFSLATSKADVMVLGEGEETLIELLKALENGADLSSLHGIAYRTPDGIRVAPRRARKTDINAIAWPAWHRFDLACYHKHRFMGGVYSSQISVPILGTRGCPYQCTYCSAPNMWTPMWIPRDPVQVVDEIEHYVKVYNAGNFPFQDLTAIVKKDWIVTFCNEIIARNLKIVWQMPSGTRSEAIDEEVAALLKRSGMISMAYAPESGSERTRQLVKKKMNTESLVSSIEAAAKADLNVAIFLVYGFPHDDAQSLSENLAFIDKIVMLNIQDVAIGFYMALPGTELFHSLYRNGKITMDRRYFTHILAAQSLIPVTSFCSLSRLQLSYWKLRTFLRFYTHPARRKGGKIGTLINITRGMFDLDHDTKMQSAIRNGIRSFIYTIRVNFGPRWMPRSQERHFFNGWDELSQRIMASNREQGIWKDVPADYTELHQHNVIKPLKTVHGSERFFRMTGS